MRQTAQPDLESMLSHAATANGWAHVIHRCAWCQHVFDEHGVGDVLVAVDDATVVITDGMCPPCGRRSLVQVAARRSGSALKVA